jgi:Ca-activated chloride channel family protein
MIEFKQAWALVSLVAAPLLVVFYIWMQRKRLRQAQKFATLSIVQEMISKGPGFRRHIPPIIFLIAIMAMMVALARPQAVITLPSREGTVILAIDVSGSMRADDFKPTRIEAAKAAARAFVEKQTDATRIGIVTFSSYAALVQPPTTNKDLVLRAINRITLQRRTAIGDGILTSLTTILGNESDAVSPFSPSYTNPRTTPNQPGPSFTPTVHSPAIVVLLSDGQSNTGISPLDAADRAAAAGVRVFTIGVGTVQGTVIQGFGGGGPGGPSGGGGGFRTFLDEKTLKQVADTTDASYFHADDEQALVKIYEGLDAETILRTEKTEITFLFTAIGIGFMIVSAFFSLLWFNRMP